MKENPIQIIEYTREGIKSHLLSSSTRILPAGGAVLADTINPSSITAIGAIAGISLAVMEGVRSYRDGKKIKR